MIDPPLPKWGADGVADHRLDWSPPITNALIYWIYKIGVANALIYRITF